MIIKLLTILAVTALGMIGGQCHKWTRRYILPSLATVYTAIKEKKNKLKALTYLILICILSCGYGTNSKLKRICRGSDTATRIVYGLLVSIPFIVFGKYIAIILLPIAWSVRAGGFNITSTKHFLYEDLIRYGTVGVLVVL